MKKILYVLFFIAGIFLADTSEAQHFNVKTDSLVYKNVDGYSLKMFIYRPDWQANIKLPAIVFFFGGGWVSGNPSHFNLQATYLASRGMIAICPDYRTKNRHNTTPFESVKDAKSAMRFIKIHADSLEIDVERIIAAGGSAGGHLAACTAIIDAVNEETDDLSVSPKPMALVLFNPVVDTGKRGYGQEKLDGREFEISPVHHITEDAPTTLIMHGKADTTVPYENVVRFKHAMKQEGNKCILVGYKGQKHGFFNYKNKPKYFYKTLQKTEWFLDEYNLLRGSGWLKKYMKELKNSPHK